MRHLPTRLGDSGFRHLFHTSSIFLPLGNNCYQQLCGPPIHDMYDPKRHVKAQQPPAPGNQKRKRDDDEKVLVKVDGARKLVTKKTGR